MTTFAIENPEQRLAPEIVQVLDEQRRAALDLITLHDRVVPASDIQGSAAESRLAALLTAFEPADIDVADLNQRLKGATELKHMKVAEGLRKLIDVKLERYSKDVHDKIHITLPPPPSGEFWWARSDGFDTDGHTGDWRDDGLHFWGGPKLDKWNVERHESFGATAQFTLAPDRFPITAGGTWASRPHVELFGGLLAYAPDWDLLQGSGIASCDLFLRQTLFQIGFGMEGPAPKILADASNTTELISLHNTGASRHVGLPGFKPLPELRFPRARLAPLDNLFATIEVRFDIHLKSAGALVWCDPEVLLRTFQWAIEVEP